MDGRTAARPVTDRHAFELGALERYLHARPSGFGRPLTVLQAGAAAAGTVVLADIG